MATPNWLGASSNSAPQANQVNQFLGTHASTVIYTGTSQGSSTTLAGSATNSNGLYIAQTFTPGSNQTIQRWILTLAVTGSPNPLIFSIQTNNAGAPSGTILTSTTIPAQFVAGSAGQLSVPTGAAALTSGTQYWFVFNAVGDVSNFYSVSRTTAASGASTSPNGSTWTAQAYGLYYQRFDASVVTPIVHTYEDSGVRWTTLGVNATSRALTSLNEYTVAQAANDYVSSVRTFTSTNGLLTSIT